MNFAQMLIDLFSINKPYVYRSQLEQYIAKHNPQTVCDVERLTRQFESKKGFILWKQY
jgi:hypothetical protein